MQNIRSAENEARKFLEAIRVQCHNSLFLDQCLDDNGEVYPIKRVLSLAKSNPNDIGFAVCGVSVLASSVERALNIVEKEIAEAVS